MDRLSAFDGKHLPPLVAIVAEVTPTKPVLNEIISLAMDPDLRIQTASTWLLKNWAEKGVRLTQAQLEALFASLPEIAHWEARLHLCQILPHVRIPKECDKILVWFLEGCLQDENKYLRAWAYNGFYELSQQFPAYNDRVNGILEAGEMEKSAAVKARIRNIRKLMNKKKSG